MILKHILAFCKDAIFILVIAFLQMGFIAETFGQEIVFGTGTRPGDKKTFTVNGVDFTFCWCPPGEFMMGSSDSEVEHDNDEWQHRVKLTQGFWLLESEVTQEMWESVMGNAPLKISSKIGQGPA